MKNQLRTDYTQVVVICTSGTSERGRLMYPLIMKVYKQVNQQEWKEGWNQFWKAE